jgi:hypothetical protein
VAKVQTRRSVSLSRATYDAIMQAAHAAGLSASEWLTQLIRVQCSSLPPQAHRGPKFPEPVVVHVAAATPEPPRRPTPVPVSPQPVVPPVVPPGRLCANCVEAPATHMGFVDRTGQKYAICDRCELPTHEERV